MTRLGILVEGKTEFEFIICVLAPFLLQFGICAEPFSIGGRGRKRQRGGAVSADSMVETLVIRSKHYDFVTSLVDFYGFRRRGKRSVGELELLIFEGLQKRLGAEACRLIPYVQLHEFEALLFSEVSAFSVISGITPGMIRKLENILKKYGSPEKINSHYDTCPSRWILSVFPRYDKVRHGREIAIAIGIERMRKMCPRFCRWTDALIEIGSK